MKKQAKEKLPLGMVPLIGCRCRCGHEWLPRRDPEGGEPERPAVCPKCKSPRWHLEKTFSRGKGGKKIV